jgi:MerR family transcriptional regulator, redox-sensitive transcriptional activator SoxR
VKIGELAARTGLNASAIRYYEALGLLPAPHRTGGQRRYSDEALHRVLLICFASTMGFTLGEIKVFLAGLPETTPVGPRWKELAQRKIKEADQTIDRSLRLKALFQHLLRCRCATLKICVERLSLSPNLKEIADTSKSLKRGRNSLRSDRRAH